MANEREIKNVAKTVRFKFSDRAVSDLTKVCQNFKDLYPRKASHKFPDGIERTVFSLDGTIPISYKSNTYHIPIAMFFLDNHPYAGPYCYVRPTETMMIKASKYVDNEGRVYLPYLTEWRYPNYDTVGLIQVMIIAFQEKCPVYAKGSQPAPLPQPAAIPPYPTQSPVQMPQPTPYPQIGLSSPGYPSSNPGYPTSTPPYPQAYQPAYQPFVPDIHQSGSSQSLASQNSNNFYNTIQPNHIRDSLTSAVETKLKERLKEMMGTPYAELQSIEVNTQELKNGNQKLRDMLDQMEKEQRRLKDIKAIYEDKKQELTKALESVRASGSNKSVEDTVDEAIDAATPLHKQILQCYVEDCAIDDTIYALGQALKKGTITLPVYLKCVRQLSRKQFKKRATLHKARQAAGLPV
ncbi:unnamed protein product [Bursaphelenchus okinawaensis]|uniref:UEV domain-containing protein n=1 Tax=Bursaphelenchus okinawaensis TaxID=465554 RepID=A0A811L3S2_9BILA|nr:unnamed protein product [Bursaphelenchus okinawaensis]CAG9115545.1 unnamed protein product [Bursaphelenchus okinawaensis]